MVLIFAILFGGNLQEEIKKATRLKIFDHEKNISAFSQKEKE
jgi:hypothetical protein